MTLRTWMSVALAAAAGSAAAHTGHGHDDLDTLHGVLHALTEPDHLLMLGAGLVVLRLATPRVLHAVRRARTWLARRRSGTAQRG